MRRKLILILTEFPPKFGGMQTHAISICAHLKEEYDLTIFTYKTPKLLRPEAKAFDQSVSYQVRRELSRISFFYNIDKLQKEVHKIQPQLIYSSTIFYGYLKNYTSVPIICRSVGNDMLRPWIIYPFRWGSSLLSNPWLEATFHWLKAKLAKPPNLDAFFAEKRKALSLECAAGAHFILANSDYTKSIFDQKNIKHCQVLAGGVAVEKYARPPSFDRAKSKTDLGLKRDSFVLITACRFVKKKGLDFLIESFQRLEEEYTNLELVIIGDGPLRKILKAGVRSTNIHLVGKLTQEEITPYYWSADLFVLCSREVLNPLTGYKDVETMGRVLCEANAAGVPVLASDTGGVGSIIEHNSNGLLYETDDYPSFRKHFDDIYQNPSKVKAMIRKGQDRARKEFNWPILIHAHQQLFTEVIEAQV